MTGVLLFNARKHFSHPSKISRPKRSLNPERLPSREFAQKNAQIKAEPTFDGKMKPENIAKWEAEFFELTRQMSAQIDVKMAAISQLTNEASRVCQRMEILMERIESRMRQNPSAPAPVKPTLSPISQQSPAFDPEPRESQNERPAPPTRPVPPASPSSAALPLSQHLKTRRNGMTGLDWESGEPTGVSAKRTEPANDKTEAIFPRLSSMTDLGYSDDLKDLAAIGAGLLHDDSSKPAASGSKTAYYPAAGATSASEPALKSRETEPKGSQPGTLPFSNPNLSFSGSNPQFRGEKKPVEFVMPEDRESLHREPRNSGTERPQSPPSGTILRPQGEGFIRFRENQDQKGQIQLLSDYGFPVEEIAHQLNISVEEVESTLGGSRRAA